MGRTCVLGLCAAALACTSVKMVQREGCWVKRTETSPFGGSREELGFCSRPAPAWAEDRLSRLVQECMSQADYRWENRALAAWTRGEPIPPQESDEQIAKICMGHASQALGIEAENGALKSRLAELSHDRDSLKSATEKDRDFLEQTSDKMVTALGEAAKKPAPTATATATSTGTARTESDLRPGQPAPPTTVVGIGGTPVMAPVQAAPILAPMPKARAPVQACAPRKLARSAGKDAAARDCPRTAEPAPAAAAEPARGG